MYRYDQCEYRTYWFGWRILLYRIACIVPALVAPKVALNTSVLRHLSAGFYQLPAYILRNFLIIEHLRFKIFVYCLLSSFYYK